MTPFVSSRFSKNVEVEYQTKWEVPKKTITGEEYLAQWKREGGHDLVDTFQNKPDVWEEPARSKS